VLGGFGFLLAVVMWQQGPWDGRMPAIDWPEHLTVYWPINAVALATWAWCEVRRRQGKPAADRIDGDSE
jgi:hypothetical protein